MHTLRAVNFFFLSRFSSDLHINHTRELLGIGFKTRLVFGFKFLSSHLIHSSAKKTMVTETAKTSWPCF